MICDALRSLPETVTLGRSKKNYRLVTDSIHPAIRTVVNMQPVWYSIHDALITVPKMQPVC